MRLLFCGTPQFAVPTLQHLLAQSDFEIAGVITQPDRPRGRGQEVTFSPVKATALAANVPIFQPEKIRASESEQLLRDAKVDAIVIIAYGQIVPARLLSIPKLGWINSHASLLPKYRGAAPIQWVLANGGTRTGVTTMRIDAGMDTGEMLLRKEISISPDENTPQLAARLAEISAPLMAETLRGLRDSTVRGTPQNHAEATLAPLLEKEDGRINWLLPAQTIYDRMRGFTPWPGAFSPYKGVICQIWGSPASADAAEGSGNAVAQPPGTIQIYGANLLVSCGEKTLLHVSRVKPEGRREVSAPEFINGARIQSGEQFG